MCRFEVYWLFISPLTSIISLVPFLPFLFPAPNLLFILLPRPLYSYALPKVFSNSTVSYFPSCFLANVSRVLPSSAANRPYIPLWPLSNIPYVPPSPSNIICSFSPSTITYISSYSCCSPPSLIRFIIFLIFRLFPSFLFSSFGFSFLSSPLFLSHSAPLTTDTVHVVLSVLATHYHHRSYAGAYSGDTVIESRQALLQCVQPNTETILCNAFGPLTPPLALKHFIFSLYFRLSLSV
jgi:hypothetical protein